MIKITKLYQINQQFLYLSTKTFCVTDSILTLGAVRLPILYSLTQYAVSSFYVGIQNSYKVTEKNVLAVWQRCDWNDFVEY